MKYKLTAESLAKLAEMNFDSFPKLSWIAKRENYDDGVYLDLAVEPIRWKPEYGETYYAMSIAYNAEGPVVESLGWINDAIDNANFNYCNCYRTEAEAQTAVERVKKALRGEA